MVGIWVAELKVRKSHNDATSMIVGLRDVHQTHWTGNSTSCTWVVPRIQTIFKNECSAQDILNYIFITANYIFILAIKNWLSLQYPLENLICCFTSYQC